MKKRKTSKTSVIQATASTQRPEAPTIVTKTGTFTFPNGDKYEGDYAISVESSYLFRQGRGTYDTEDFNKYECTWKADKLDGDIFIRFNNGTEFQGSVDENGKMSGQGTYYLPDGSSILAEWKENKLFSNIRYKEPLRYIWTGTVSGDEKIVRFSAGNHFWSDINSQDDKKL